MEEKRLTAIKSSIGVLARGKFHPAEGFTSGYIVTSQGSKVSRARVMATVVGKFVSEDGLYGSLTLDDETDTIRVKIFKNTKIIEDIEVGDIVDVFGKMREYNGEIYVSPEIVRKITDPNYLILRMAELSLSESDAQKTREKIESLKAQAADLSEVKKLAKVEGIDEESVEIAAKSEDVEKKTGREMILDIITKLDEGNGTGYETVLEKSGLEEEMVDDIVNELLSEGTCYEPRPGKIKRL